MMINESRLAMLRRARARRLNESSIEVVSKKPEGNKNPGRGEWTFADWFGEDLTGKTYKGSIDCSYADLTSLKGAPEKVGGGFYCVFNKLTSLKGGPKEVGGYFICSHNNLTSLKGAPETVGEDFNCSNNKLTSLEGAPSKVGEDFICSDNNLTSMEGAPETVGKNFICSHNNLPEDEFPDTEIGGNLVIDHATHLYRGKAGREKLKTARTGRATNRAIDKGTLKGLMRNVEEIFVTMEEAGFLESDPEMETVQKLWGGLNKLF